MKKFKFIAVLLIFVFTLSGCSASFDSYPDADKYTAGDAVISETVEGIDIDWSCGAVTVAAHDRDTVEATETVVSGVKGELDDSLRMHWYLDGTTLRIRFSAPRQHFFTLYSPALKKDLTVYVPSDLALSDLAIDSSSGNTNISGLKIDNMDLHSSSGDIELSQTAPAKDIKVSLSSGNLKAGLGAVGTLEAKASSGILAVEQSGKAGSVSLRASSGGIRCRLGDVGTLESSCSSGATAIAADSASSASVKASSGNIACSFNKVPGECGIRSSSGDVDLSLPADGGFTVKTHISSGKVFSDFPVTLSGDDTYTVGDGSGKIDIDISSGNFTLSPIN